MTSLSLQVLLLYVLPAAACAWQTEPHAGQTEVVAAEASAIPEMENPGRMPELRQLVRHFVAASDRAHGSGGFKRGALVCKAA